MSVSYIYNPFTNNLDAIGGSSSPVVSSIAGTDNQIDVSASIGDVIISMTDGISIGDYQSTSPPTGGIIAPGSVAFGTSTASSSKLTIATSSESGGILLNGSFLSVDASANQTGVSCTSTFLGGSNISASYSSTPIFRTLSLGILTAAAGYYASPLFTSNVGIIQNSYGFWFDGGGASAGTIVSSYGAYLKNPVAGSVKCALYSDNFSIGYSSVAPPSNGGLIKGSLAIGVNAITAGSSLSIFSTPATSKKYGIDLSGTLDAVAGDLSQYSVLTSQIFSPVSGSVESAGFHSNPSFVAPTGQTIVYASCFYGLPFTNANVGTISNLHGILIDAGTVNSGTVTNAYGGFFNNPNAGVNQCALYAEDQSIGYAGTTPPVNGLVINGATGIGTNNPTSTLHLTRNTAASSGTTSYFQLIPKADTGLTASTEVPTAIFSLSSAIQTWATGNITTQRFVRFTQPTIAFAGASTVTDCATVGISGPVVPGTNATLSNSHGLFISAGSAATGAVVASGLTVNAPTGGTTNYSAQFLGGFINVTSGTGTTPAIGITSSSASPLFLQCNGSNTSTAIGASGIAFIVLKNNAVSTLGNSEGILGKNHNSASSAGIDFVNVNQNTSATAKGAMRLWTFLNGTASSALYLDENTNVGVGTESPVAKLTVNGNISTVPSASSTVTTGYGSSLTAGTALRNTLGYDILINVCVTVTASTTATIVAGVGSTSTPTTNTVVPSFTVAASSTYIFSLYVPNSFYALVDTTGTITIGSITVQAMGV